jgi:Cutinase
MKFSIAAIGLVAVALGHPLAGRATCPSIHVFGARETTASPGYGSSITVVNDILNGYPGSTAEAINYPACGGQASCGGDSYSQSVAAGVSAAVTAVNNYAAECPSTQLVLVGYSQVRTIVKNRILRLISLGLRDLRRRLLWRWRSQSRYHKHGRALQRCSYQEHQSRYLHGRSVVSLRSSLRCWHMHGWRGK